MSRACDGALGPSWLERLTPALPSITPVWPALPEDAARLTNPAGRPRPQQPPAERASAVLALFSADDDPALVFTVRNPDLSHHPGQISFPGGGREPDDPNPAATALREANEEVGLEAATAHILGQLRNNELAVSHNLVAPVVAWSDDVDSLAVRDRHEVAALRRWRVSRLADPAFRVMAAHPRGGVGPAWQCDDDFLWGFTAHLVDVLLRLGGWEQPWDTGRVVPIPARFRADSAAPS